MDQPPNPGLARLPWTPARRAGFALYQVLLHPVALLFLLRILARRRREPLYAADLGQRFGAVPRLAPGSVWVHAASLGETRAAAPLVAELLARGERVVLTHTSPAGLTEGRRQFAAPIADGRVVQLYQPLDLSWVLARFLSRTRPRLALTVDSETWPGMIAACTARGIPVAKVNANLSERALERDLGRRLGRFRLFFWQGLSLVVTKSAAHVARYRRAGIAPGRIRDAGEMRFDIPHDTRLLEAAARLRPLLAGTRPVLLIASSNEAEEAALLDVLDRLRAGLQAPPFVAWAPRSPQRFDAVAGALAARGWRLARRSRDLDAGFRPLRPLEGTEVLLGDTLGEMDALYAMADAVFVGGTLADKGGHNVTEPLSHGRPVLTGPSTWRIPAPAEEAQASGAMRVLPDAGALAGALLGLFADPDALAAFQSRTEGLGARHRGAAARTAEAVLALAPQPAAPAAPAAPAKG